MVKSPSKYLGRPFLRSLLESRCVTTTGKEYSEDEVRELLHEKERRLAEQEFKREMQSLKPVPPSLEEISRQIMTFQSTLPKTTLQSSVEAPSFFNCDTILNVAQESSKRFDVTTTSTRQQSGGLASKSPIPNEFQTEAKPSRSVSRGSVQGEHLMKAPKLPKSAREVSSSKAKEEIERSLAYLNGLAQPKKNKRK